MGIALFAKLRFVFDHFAHYDDLWGVYRAQHIFRMQPSEILEKIPFIPTYIKRFSDNIFLIFILKYISAIRETVSGNKFAPLHYALANLTLFLPLSPRWYIFAARLPSYLEYLGLIGVILSFSSRSKSTHLRIGYFIFAILGILSSLLTYYSAQAHFYMFGTLASAFFFLILSFKGLSRSKYSIILISLLYSLCILSSYMFIAFLPSFAVFVIVYWANRASRVNVELKLVNVVAILTPFAISLILKNFVIGDGKTTGGGSLKELGIGWQKGFNSEYVVSYEDYRRFFVNLFHAWGDTCTALFLPPNPPEWVGITITLIVTLLCIGGIITLLKSLSGINLDTEAPLLLAVLTLFNSFGLYFTGLIALSPTRHSLYLYPILACICPYGLVYFQNPINALSQRLKKTIPSSNKYHPYIALAALSTLLLISDHAFALDMRNRTSALKNKELYESLSGADVILYRHYYNFEVNIMAARLGFNEKMIQFSDKTPSAILLYSSDRGRRQPKSAVFITNDPSDPGKREVKLALESISCLNADIRSILNKKSVTIVDPVRTPITTNGTNSVHAYSGVCK